MIEQDSGLTHHPAPHRAKVARWRLLLALGGAPLAWFIQLNLNYGLLAQPCYPGPERNAALPAHSAWTWPASLVVYIGCVLLAVIATLVAIGIFRATKQEEAGENGEFEEVGHGRSRFLAYWGILLGVGFSVAAAVNLLAILTVPPCVQ